MREALIAFGIKGDIEKVDLTVHELDATISAYVGKQSVRDWKSRGVYNDFTH